VQLLISPECAKRLVCISFILTHIKILFAKRIPGQDQRQDLAAGVLDKPYGQLIPLSGVVAQARHAT
jgi:hypothetical protein